jgi:hypothetical protein
MYYSNSGGWKPWWEKVADLDTPQEREEFMRGVSGLGLGKGVGKSVLTGIIAGVVGGSIAKSAIDKRKK